MTTTIKCLAICLALVLLTEGQAWGLTTVNLAPVDDAYGTFSSASNQWTLTPDDPFLFLSRTFAADGDGDQRAALEFNLSVLPLNANVTSALLHLEGTAANNNVGVHGYVGNGVIEATDLAVTNLITTFDPAIGPNIVDVTGFIQGLYPSDPTAGFALRELVQGEFTAFFSSRASTFADPPRLVITLDSAAIPEPLTALLSVLGLGAVGLGLSRRRST